ncbi:transcriptional repressor [Xanthomonas massiliensis]|jgi:Fe2+ or Zn2+ uptake regulation protein|uniref:transcriptional repressor n=1 Tax=Xanthomonas massiliensis TaxID=1720302 RepID=UPI00082542F5|nr:transcriptional repressor [Xanthomonas massiliensis]
MATEDDAAAGALLAAAGLRRTPARDALLQVLRALPAPADALQLHRLMQARCGHANLSTLYRGLRDFERLGWLQVQATPRGRMHWRLRPDLVPATARAGDGHAPATPSPSVSPTRTPHAP